MKKKKMHKGLGSCIKPCWGFCHKCFIQLNESVPLDSSRTFQNSSCHLLFCPTDSKSHAAFSVLILGGNYSPKMDFPTQFSCFIIHFCESHPWLLLAILTISSARLLFLDAALTFTVQFKSSSAVTPRVVSGCCSKLQAERCHNTRSPFSGLKWSCLRQQLETDIRKQSWWELSKHWAYS